MLMNKFKAYSLMGVHGTRVACGNFSYEQFIPVAVYSLMVIVQQLK
jgi:hypothetical protein